MGGIRMLVIDVISLIGLVICLTTLIIGGVKRDLDLYGIGGVMFLAWVIINIIFQIGACWQRSDDAERAQKCQNKETTWETEYTQH